MSKPSLLLRSSLTGLLALAVSLPANAYIPDRMFGYDTDIPLTAQTAGDSVSGPGNRSPLGVSLQATLLLPVGTALDIVLTGFICVHLSSELTSRAFAGAEEKIVAARDDATMYLATDGDHLAVHLQAALEHLRRFREFDGYTTRDLAELILVVTTSAAGADGA
jgi:uncharacterized protein (TIGR02448 family)